MLTTPGANFILVSPESAHKLSPGSLLNGAHRRTSGKSGFESNLELAKALLPAGSEWPIPSNSWCFLCLISGVAYWLHPRSRHELTAGSALLVFPGAPGVIRASQLGEVSISYFRVAPARLTGLFSLGEQQTLERLSVRDFAGGRFFEGSSAMAQTYTSACAHVPGNGVRLRLRLLNLFVEALRDQIDEEKSASANATDARTRLATLLNEMPVAELLELTFGGLVAKVRCTPRHLTRIFHELVGMSFREKQSQLRLSRAQELLATTDSKMVEIALESGYQSISLFNVMFKRRFGITPAQWRTRSRSNTPRAATPLSPAVARRAGIMPPSSRALGRANV